MVTPYCLVDPKILSARVVRALQLYISLPFTPAATHPGA